MNRADLLDKMVELDESGKMTKALANIAVSLVGKSIAAGLEAGEKVQIAGLITAEPVARSGRKGFNPQTNEELEIAPKMAVKIKSGSHLDKAVEELNVQDFLDKKKKKKAE
jgi:nucleoid DNA-binding protein